MFSNPTILVTTPEACKQVLMDDDGFVNGWLKATVALIGPKSFVAMPYDEHRRLRKLTAAPINGFDALTAYLPFIDRTVTSSLRAWSGECADGGEVEFLTELRRMTFKIIVQIFLGGADDATMHSLERSYTDLNYGMRAMAINLPGFAYRRALGARRRLVSVLQGVLDERRAATAKGFTRSSSVDMMDRLIEVEDEHGRRLDDDEIIDILIMYLNAGHESSGHITMWATVFLQENPDIFAKAKVCRTGFIIVLKKVESFQLRRHYLEISLVDAASFLPGRAGGDHEEHSTDAAGADAEGLQEDGVPLTGNVFFVAN